MTVTTEMRKSVRVMIKDGQLRLHHPVMPPLNCTLVDMSEEGARGRMHTSSLDKFASTAWRQLIGSGKFLQVEILAPGQDTRCRIESDVRHHKLLNESEIEFGFRFRRPDTLQHDIIQRAIHSFTQNPERTAAGSMDEHSTTVFQALRAKKPSSTTTHAISPIPAPAKPAKQKTIVDMARGFLKGLSGSGGAGKLNSLYREMKIGEILMRTGRLTPKQAVEAYEKSRAAGQKFGRYLLVNGLISPVELCRALSLQSGLPVVDLASAAFPVSVIGLFDHETMMRNQFVPFNQFGTTLYIAAAQPLSKTVMKDLERTFKGNLKVFLAQDDVIAVALNSPFFAPDRKKR